MPVKKKKPSRKPIEQYTDIAVRVDLYEVRATASINHDLLSPERAYLLDDDDPVYQFDTHLEIIGTSIAPSSRAGDEYHLSLCGDGAP